MTENTSNNSPKQKPFHINSYSFIHNKKTPKMGVGVGIQKKPFCDDVIYEHPLTV